MDIGFVMQEVASPTNCMLSCITGYGNSCLRIMLQLTQRCNHISIVNFNFQWQVKKKKKVMSSIFGDYHYYQGNVFNFSKKRVMSSVMEWNEIRVMSFIMEWNGVE